MRSKSRAGGRGQEGRVCGQLPPGTGEERNGAGKLGEAQPSSAVGLAGLGDGRCGPAEERVLLTGLHAVADIYCENCKTTLGWKYVSTEGSVGGERAVKKLMRVTGMHSPTCFPGLVGLSAMSMGNRVQRAVPGIQASSLH